MSEILNAIRLKDKLTIAGAMAVGILLATMIFRVISINSAQRRQKTS